MLIRFFAELLPATLLTIKDLIAVACVVVTTFIGLSAKWSALQTKREQERTRVDQDRLDAGLAWEREQRIAERKELNDRVWKLEEKLRECEASRARIQAVYDEWKSSNRRPDSV